jgi:hypothetical protein
MPWKHKPIPANIGDHLYIDKTIPHGLRWSKPRSRSVKVGDPAGSLKQRGQYMVRFYCDFYLNHRIIYFLETGNDPGQKQIDHVKHDDNAGPLRLVTHQQNQFNRRKRRGSCSRYKGVVATKGKWSAGITVDGNRHHLGLFNTEVEAALAYNQAAVSMFGEYAFLNTFDDQSYY